MKKYLGKILLSTALICLLCGCDLIGGIKSKNSITEKELIGTWKFDDYEIHFKEDGTYEEDGEYSGLYKIVGNWIVLDDEYSLYYEYIDGELYITEAGQIMRKK